MSGDRPAPVIEGPLLLPPEEGARAIIGEDWDPPRIATPGRAHGSLVYLVAGGGLLVSSWLLFSIISSLIGFFHVSPALGTAASAIAALAVALLGAGALREWRSMRGLRRVEHLRAALHSGADTAAARELCLSWLEWLGPQVTDPAGLTAAIREANDVAQIRGVLQARLTEPLHDGTRAIALRAASQASALMAITPHESWDALIVALRGLKVIREVAQFYGLRPGPAVTLALAGRVSRAAVESAAVELVSQAAADHVLTNLPLLRHVSAAAGVSTAAFRLYRLTLAAGRACNPLVT